MAKASSSKTTSTQKPQPKKSPITASSDPTGLHQLLADGLKTIYWTENYLLVTLPKIESAAGNPKLKKAVADHLRVTKGHVTRLEKIFELLGQSPLPRKSDAMEGLAMEGECIINTTVPDSAARTLGLIMSCQKVEQFEMTTYTGLSSLARQLGESEVAGLLDQTMAEEAAANQTLTALAEKQ